MARENIIIDNRLVSDMTFALRFYGFIRDVTVCDACGEEEKDYLLLVAQELKAHQVATVTDEREKDYLRMNGIEIPDEYGRGESI